MDRGLSACRSLIIAILVLFGEDHSDFMDFEFLGHSASSEMLACSVGDSPTGEKVRDPVAWVAFVEETKRMKPTDKAILGMVSESPGRNVSEPRSGLDKKI